LQACQAYDATRSIPFGNAGARCYARRFLSSSQTHETYLRRLSEQRARFLFTSGFGRGTGRPERQGDAFTHNWYPPLLRGAEVQHERGVRLAPTLTRRLVAWIGLWIQRTAIVVFPLNQVEAVLAGQAPAGVQGGRHRARSARLRPNGRVVRNIWSFLRQRDTSRSTSPSSSPAAVAVDPDKPIPAPALTPTDCRRDLLTQAPGRSGTRFGPCKTGSCRYADERSELDDARVARTNRCNPAKPGTQRRVIDGNELREDILGNAAVPDSEPQALRDHGSRLHNNKNRRTSLIEHGFVRSSRPPSGDTNCRGSIR
jgi:hypothetical protein